MFWLLLGVLLWSGAHLLTSALPDKRKELIEKFEEKKYMMLFSGVIVLSIILMIVGWRSAEVEALYQPAELGKPLNILFMLVAIVLFAAAHGKSRLKQYVRHPMLTATHIWALGHLLANGDNRSLLLFGGLLLWSSLSIYFINKRDGEWIKPTEVGPMEQEIKLAAIAVVAYLILVWLHPYYAGVSVM